MYQLIKQSARPTTNFPPAISILSEALPCREQRNHRKSNHRLFSPDLALISTACRRVCSHPPVSWREINARVGACTLPWPGRTVPFAREHSHRAFPFSRWFTARTCLGRCRSHNGESCRRRSPPDTVITGWHLPGRDHNDNGRFAGKTSSYTPGPSDGPRDEITCAPIAENGVNWALVFTVVVYPARESLHVTGERIRPSRCFKIGSIIRIYGGYESRLRKQV